MEIYIDNRQSEINISEYMEELFQKVIKESLLVEGKSLDYEVSVSLVDNSEIKELNRDYRGVDNETDVLSFPLDDDFGMDLPLLGDIIISVEKAVEQAEEYGHSLERELAYLTAHSMFHLMGYDHMEKEEKEIMRSKEKLVMQNVGLFKFDKGE
ncbi:MAG: rRNA maturation RNase YbeY [Tissierella sp.]|nr:rRNA maturation RNase YbeY [Tissierella sp.]